MSGAALVTDDRWDDELRSLTHPSDWTNPEPASRYNLVVIGGGPAGLVAAAGAAGLGARVALVERALLGGDCLVTGCVPSKALLRAAQAAYEARSGRELGVGVDAATLRLDFARAMERLRKLRAGLAHHDSAERFTRLGVDVFLGEGRFVSPSAFEVDGKRLRFHRAVITTGARAAEPPITGLQDVEHLTNETLFALTSLPQHLLVIGAGPIGCEMAQAFRRFGSEVTIVDRDAQLLSREDPDAAEVLQAQFDREGIRQLLGLEVLRAGQAAGQRALVLRRDGKEQRLVGDSLLVAVGRAPNVEGLGLDAAGVRYARHGVEVDDRLRTTNPRIYAAGDVCSRYKFTHAADAMARIVLQNALFFGRKQASALVIPWCTYTSPEIAHVGMNSEQASTRGKEVMTLTVKMNEVDRAVLDGDTGGFARAHVERKSGRILGATMVSAHAGESIAEMSLAITGRAKISTLAATIHPYPTQAEAWKKLGDAWSRTRLTPWVARLMKTFLGWFSGA